MRKALILMGLALAAPATAADGNVWIGGAYLSNRAAMLDARATALFQSIGVDLWAYGMYDATYTYPLTTLHGAASVIAATRSEGFELAGLFGISYAGAQSHGNRQSAVAPDVGARFLWSVSTGLRIRLEGALSMYSDGFTFYGGISAERVWKPWVTPFVGWRLYWVTAENEDDIIKNGVVIGLAFGSPPHPAEPDR